ncbi:MAG: phosphoglycerate dehydrogenase, partial [Candidatus Marinimicrobia bacterium CG_4_10_14_0_2_um_filter_48_9]
MIRVLVTDTIVQQGIDLLSAAGYEVLQIPFSETEKMVEALPTVQAWVIRSGSQISAELLDKATNLKVIGRAGVGVDNVDLAAA